MGLFKRFFKNKQLKEIEKLVDNSKYPNDWEYYWTLLNGKRGSIQVNLGLKKITPISKLSWLLKISIKMNVRTEDGLLSKDEAILFGAVDRKLRLVLTKNSACMFVGHVCFDGYVYLYFYCKYPIDQSLISKAMKENTDYQYVIKNYKDENWKEYLETLYPTDEQLFSIENRQKTERLNADGDSLTRLRFVFHTIMFIGDLENADKKANGFLNEAEILEFIKEDVYFKGDIYVLTIKRLDKVVFFSLDEYTLKLRRAAKKHGGEYRGWNTTLERDE